MEDSTQNKEQLTSIESGIDAIAEALHERWRSSLVDSSGNALEDFEQTNDRDWIAKHGTDLVDIANTSFHELPADWKAENTAAAQVVMSLLLENNGMIRLHDQSEFIRVGNIVHQAWRSRNDGEDAQLNIPFEDLSYDEQDKDIAQIQIGMQIWAHMHLSAEADRGYENETEFFVDPTTGSRISYREFLENASAARRQAELIKQAEEPEVRSHPLKAEELQNEALKLVGLVEGAVPKWGIEPEVKLHRGKRYERYTRFDKDTSIYCNILFVYEGESSSKQQVQVTYSGKSSREYFVDIQMGDHYSISEVDHPHHEDDLGIYHSNTDTALQKALSVINNVPGVTDPTLA